MLYWIVTPIEIMKATDLPSRSPSVPLIKGDAVGKASLQGIGRGIASVAFIDQIGIRYRYGCYQHSLSDRVCMMKSETVDFKADSANGKISSFFIVVRANLEAFNSRFVLTKIR